MVTEHRHKHDTGRKLVNFVQERLTQFTGSRTPKLVDTGKALVTAVSRLFADQEGAAAQLAAATEDKARLRDQMREQARVLLRTVRVFSPVPAATAAQVEMNGRSDKKLVAAVTALRDHASAFVGELPDHGLPADYLQTLTGAIDEFETACDAQDKARDAHMAAGAAADQNVKALMDVRRKLDVIVRNQYRDDPATLEVWQKMRRIGSGPVQPDTKPATASDAKSATGSGTGSDAKSDTRVA